MHLGIVDLGTNSIRLFIYNIVGSSRPEICYQEKHMVRLGKDVYSTGKLNKQSKLSTMESLKNFKKACNEFNVVQVNAVATSAARVAKDAPRFFNKIKEDIGFDFRIISGQEEAEYIARGVIENNSLPAGPLLLMDIGGGSTELSLTEGHTIHWSDSLTIGAAGGQQNFLKEYPPKKGSIKKLKQHILDLLCSEMHHHPEDPIVKAIGSSGSIRALARIMREDRDEEGEFTINQLKSFVSEIKNLKLKQIIKYPGMEERRADIILSASILLFTLLEHFKIGSVKTTRFALKDGILSEFVSNSSKHNRAAHVAE